MKRFRNAVAVLFGRQLTPQQITAQWLEYQVAFDGIFDKLNVALARMAKRDSRAAERMAEVLAQGAPEPDIRSVTPHDRKAELRRRVFAGMRRPSRDAARVSSAESPATNGEG